MSLDYFTEEALFLGYAYMAAEIVGFKSINDAIAVLPNKIAVDRSRQGAIALLPK
ncbi:MAG: hypothetical protein F6J93_36640 [Oscillatoria sp. SIO1A7]|nr:hypothetical protein [Oscillatoria sp. SIO1A7]